MTDQPHLQRGIGTPTRCRTCKQEIVFAIMYTTGKKAPFQKDHEGEWVMEAGLAKHVGKLDVQPDLFAAPPKDQPQRYTSHFAVCKQADDWRSK